MNKDLRRIVITGYGAVTPVGIGVESFWQGLLNGKNGIGPITLFDAAEYKTKLAAEVRDFDPLNYMEKSETLRTDRYSQFALVAADEALQMSGIVGKVVPERIAVYMGSGIGGLQTFIDEHNKLIQKGPRRVSPLLVPMMISNMASGLIAIRYNCRGTAMPCVTACASGSNAIGEAMRLVHHGYADAVICGGSDAAITDLGVAGFINMQALSTSEDADKASLPFDNRRSGFVIGEGAGALVIEEYEHAKARGAKILGELVGYGSSCDAYHMTAPHPDGEGAVAAMKAALDEAGYEDGERVYINAHGTGTKLNDSAETKAIKLTLGEEAAYKAVISSIKSMTGHLLGGAGAIEAIAAIKALQTGIIPPTINLCEPDPECDLDYTPNKAREFKADIALSNSLGFGGHNASLAFRRIQ